MLLTYLTFKKEVILSLYFIQPVPVARTVVLLGPLALPITLFRINCRQSSSFSVLKVMSSILIPSFAEDFYKRINKRKYICRVESHGRLINVMRGTERIPLIRL